MKTALSLSQESLNTRIKNLGCYGDVEDEASCEELRRFVPFAENKSLQEAATAVDCLNVIHKESLGDVFPNVSIALLRLVVTLPSTVASCERSFSKLKIITYERRCHKSDY